MIVIGVDTHKRNHALAAVDAGTGRVRGSRIQTERDGRPRLKRSRLSPTGQFRRDSGEWNRICGRGVPRTIQAG